MSSRITIAISIKTAIDNDVSPLTRWLQQLTCSRPSLASSVKQIMGSQALGSQALGPQALGPQAQVQGSQALGPQAQVQGSQAQGSQALGLAPR